MSSISNFNLYFLLIVKIYRWITEAYAKLETIQSSTQPTLGKSRETIWYKKNERNITW